MEKKKKTEKGREEREREIKSKNPSLLCGLVSKCFQ